MILLLLKITLVLSVALAVLPLLGRASAAMRHLICALALGAALALPLTLAFAPHALPVALPVVFRASASGAASGSGGAIRWSALWAAGALALLLRLAFGYGRMLAVVRRARSAETGVVLGDVSVPLVCGLFRPVILLPRAADSWPLTQRNAAIRHELAHVTRGDLWTTLLAQVACAVYWFHPLVWLVARQLRHEQELACDDAVLSAGFEPADYAEALVATARTTTSTSLIGCHMLTHRTLKSRIARLLDNSLPRTTSTHAMRLAALLSVAVLGALGMIYAQPQQAPKADEKVYKMADGITAPRVASKIDPRYTDEARDAKIEGTVTLSVVVGTDGQAHQINVVKPLDGGLDLNAVEAVQQWRFTPGTKDGEPVAVRAMIEVNFRLM